MASWVPRTGALQRERLMSMRRTLLLSILLIALAAASGIAHAVGTSNANDGIRNASVGKEAHDPPEAGTEKAWIVVDLLLPDGKTVLMTFLTDDPPAAPMTLDDCEGALESSTPSLMEHIRRQPMTAGAGLKGARCVWSADDPIKPRY